MRGPNNVLFTAVQALFDEKLFLKCPDMHRPRYTPVAPPVDAQGEYNMDDNENEDDGGVDLYPAPPGDLCLIRHLHLLLDLRDLQQALIL